MKTSRAAHRVTLPRALSKKGIASRKAAERLIATGQVSVNGSVERNPHRWVNLKDDRIKVAGVAVRGEKFRYLMLNKPVGVITTLSDEKGRKTVFDVLGDAGKGLSPVGRLDKDTTGLLILTNDHQLANALTTPERGVEKTYVVSTDRDVSAVDMRSLEEGINIRSPEGDYHTKPAGVSQVRPRTVRVTIREGKNRQIRRMFEARGYDVKELQRISLAGLKLGPLMEGDSRFLTAAEIELLRSAAGHGKERPDPRGHRVAIKANNADH